MPNNNGKFTLEQLLAAKRQEKPSPQFWEDFQRDLRLKERKLLQSQQTIDDCELESAFWPRFRKYIAVACTAASCGTFGFLILQTNNPSQMIAPTTVKQGIAKTAPITPKAKTPQFTVAAAPTLEEPQTRFEAINVPVPQTVAHIADVQPASIQTQIAAASQGNSIKDFTLDIKTPFEEIDLEEVVAFNEPDQRTSQFAKGYIDPLSEYGYASKNAAVVAYRSDASPVSTRRLDSTIIDRGSRWGVRLDEVKLKF